MIKIICRRHARAGHALLIFLLFMAAIEAGCGIESTNRPGDDTTAESEEISAPIPRAPADGSVVSTASPVMDWDDVEGATAFQLQVSSTSDFNTLELDREVSTSSFTAADFILNQGTHFWRVRSKGNAGQLSAWSTVLSFTVAGTRSNELPLAVITHPTAGTTIFKGGYIDCAGSLTDGSSPADCIWEFGDMGSCEDNPAPAAVRFNEAGTYLIKFLVFAPDGGESSDEVILTVVDGSPVPVAPDDGYTAGGHALEFLWEGVEGADSYVLFIQETGETGEFNFPVQGISMEVSFDDPGEYSWSVYAIDSQGNASACSPLRTFTVP